VQPPHLSLLARCLRRFKVRLKRVNCDQAIPYPPDGQPWWHRLKNAFGTGARSWLLLALKRIEGGPQPECILKLALKGIEG
jgi:hypothetical protein